MNRRIKYVDIAKGLTMLMVVFVHTNAEVRSNSLFLQQINNFIMSFFMPAFFVYSGMFVRKETWNGFFVKKAKTILVPLFFFYLLGYVFSAIIAHIGTLSLHNDFRWTNVFNIFCSKTFSNGALWFLSALFIGLTIVQVCYRIRSNFIRYMVLVLFALIGMTWNTFIPYRLPIYADSGCYSVGYLVLGHMLMKSLKIIKLDRNIKSFIIFGLSFMLVFLLQANKASMMMATWHGNMFLSWVVGFCGAIMVLAFSSLLKDNRLLAYIGKNSIVVLCVHCFFIKPVVKIFGGHVTGVYLFLLCYIVVIVLCIVSISFLLKCCPFIIGKEKVCKECV